MMTYCRKCGAKLERRELSGFNGQTGEKNYEMVCPTGKCFHEGYPTHDAEMRFYDTVGSWLGLTNHRYDFRCRRCGASDSGIVETS